MAKSYYRISGSTRWQSSSGNALLALVNKQGSGKKFAVNSVEMYPLARLDSGTSVPPGVRFAIKRTASSGITTGDIVPLYSLDSAATSASTYAEVRTRTNDNGTATQLRSNALVLKSINPASLLTNFVFDNSTNLGTSNMGSLLGNINYKNTAIERLVARAGESIIVSANPITKCSMIYKIEVTFTINLSPERTYFTTFLTDFVEEGSNILAIINKDSSGQILYISDITISNFGTSDTPYFQVVPIGSVNSLSKYDSNKTISYTPYDSQYPTLSGIAEMYQDVPILPFNMPEYYAADSATAVVPRNFNYLATKDFIGPVYQTFLPELKSANLAGLPDTFGLTLCPDFSNIKGHGAPIIIREGEGLGIVSAAETATAATAVGFSAFLSFNYAINFSVENAFTPKLILTGLVNGSEVEILEAGTTNVLSRIEDAVNNAFSWDYDYSAGSKVDIVVHNVLYNYYRLNNISLTAEGLSIPIQQIADRNYKA